MDAAKLLALADTSCGCAEPGLVYGQDPVGLSVDLLVDDPVVAWSGVIGVENELTGDGRLIEPNALRWDLPLPLRHVSADVGAHDGAVAVGRVDALERRTGGVLWGSGIIDLRTEAGREAAHGVRERLQDGVSMDLDDVSFEVRIAADLLASDAGPPDDGADDLPVDDEGRVTVVRIESDEEVRVTTSARVRALTIVSIPAFDRARIALSAADGPSGLAASGATAVEAGPLPAVRTAPVLPPAAWFADPGFHTVSPMTITEEGRVLGHLANWNGVCHIGQPSCVRPPRSQTSYAYFHVGALLTAEGREIAVGRITLDTTHAQGALSAAGAQAHYEHTGMAVADVVAGEDGFGIWVSGALRPDVSPEKVRALRASPLSGDWRRIGGNLELVAALAVNLPGFPIPRPSGLVASGAVQTLLASGMVPPRRVLAPGTDGAFSDDDLKYLKQLIARERGEEQRGLLTDAELLARRVRTTSLGVRRSSWRGAV